MYQRLYINIMELKYMIKQLFLIITFFNYNFSYSSQSNNSELKNQWDGKFSNLTEAQREQVAEGWKAKGEEFRKNQSYNNIKQNITSYLSNEDFFRKDMLINSIKGHKKNYPDDTRYEEIATHTLDESQKLKIKEIIKAIK